MKELDMSKMKGLYMPEVKEHTILDIIKLLEVLDILK